MPINKIETTSAALSIPMEVTLSGLEILISGATAVWKGRETVFEETTHTVTVDGELDVQVCVHLCVEKATGDLAFLVDEYVLGDEVGYHFPQDGPYEWLHVFFQTVVPAGTGELSALESYHFVVVPTDEEGE